MQSIIPNGPLVRDLNVFRERVFVLVASEANNTSLFKTTRTPFPIASLDTAVQTDADKLLEPSYPSSELLLIAPVTITGLMLSIVRSRK
ncbi:Uncharacterised protein [Clostridioides difficile]|nr:Uncharacterised protein [Clostridioides difficile]